MLRFAICNEVIAGEPDAYLAFEEQCRIAATLGYDALELAPYTLGDQPHLLGSESIREIRSKAADFGLEISGLHWLLVTPADLSITSADPAVRNRTLDVLTRLIALCAELGGTIMVHGSPAQRLPEEGEGVLGPMRRATEMWGEISEVARQHGIVYCIEPLSRDTTPIINTVEEAVRIVDAINSPFLRTMVDTCSAGLAEEMPVAQLLDKWLPTGRIAHIQLNDRNRRGPGQGEDNFSEILWMLQRWDYDGICAVEPFDYVPDGYTTAAVSMAYLRGILDALD